MFDWLASLTDTTGFVPRKNCGAWTDGWVAAHTLSDVLIWLAYLSIPLVLLSAIRHPALRPFRLQGLLFAAFILACGTVHLIEAVIFEYPVYRLSGVLKVATAVISWATVFALIPTVPRLLERLTTGTDTGTPAPAEAEDDLSGDGQPAPMLYMLGILVGLLAVMLRYVLDPALSALPAHGLSILAVIFVAWYGGFGPGLVTLLVSGTLSVYLFVPERNTMVIVDLAHQVDVGVYLLTGVGVLVLGELQRRTRRRLRRKVREVNAAVAALATEKSATERALAQLDALVRNAPYAIAFYDDKLRFLRVNDALVRGMPVAAADYIGRELTEVRPDAPAEVVTAYRGVLAGGPPIVARTFAARGGMWEVSAFQVPVDADRMGMAVIAQDVTERQRAAERVRDSEERFRAMADGIPQLAWMTRPDGHIFWYNRRWFEYTGTTLDQMEGWGWQSVHDPAELPCVLEKFRRHIASGEPWEDTFPLRRHDGEMRWHLSRATPLKDDAGNVLLWFGTNTDITDQRRMEEQLRESEGRFRQLAETMPQIVWKAYPDGQRYYFNRRWYEYTGRTSDDSLGREWEDIVHPDDRPAVAARWRAAVAAGTTYEVETRLRRADGEYHSFLVRAFPVRDADGTVVRWLGTSTDIDEQVRTKQRLAESEAYIRGVLENSPDCIKVLDPDGLLLELNGPGMVAMDIDDVSCLRGAAWPDLWPVESRERVRQAIGDAAAGRVDRFSGWCPTAKGTMKFWDVMVAPIPDASGRVVRLVGVSRDVTDQKRVEDDLREAKRFNEEVLDSLPAHVTVIDADGLIVSVNNSWRQFGTDYGLLPGHRWVGTSYFSPAVADGPSRPDAELTAGVRSVLSGERTQFDAEYLSTGTDGERYFHMRANRFRGDGPVRVVVTHEDVTEQARTKQQLAAATRFAETVLDSLSSHIAVLAADGTILMVNRSWRRFGAENGMTEDYPWEGTSYTFACRDDADGERATDGIRAVAAGTVPAFEMEYPCHGPEGERYFYLRVRRFVDDDPVRLVVAHENVTARVIGERRVREAESQLRQLTEGVPLLMWSCRPSGECDYLSRQWVEYTGVPAERHLTYGWLEAVHPDDLPATTGAWSAAVAAGGGYDVEFRLRRHDNEYRWFAVRGIPLRDRSGAVARWYGSCTDVDDRKKRADTLEREVADRTTELRQQQIFVSAILDNIAEGVVACDGDGHLRLFNAATREMYGLPADQPIPRENWHLYHQLLEADGVTPVPADRLPLERAWRGEEVRDAELVIRRAGHPDRYVLCSGQQLRAAGGPQPDGSQAGTAQFGAVVSMRDMTARREFERQLQLTAAALRASNEELDKFAYVASHDLQEPLRKIQTFGSRLADKSGDRLDEGGKDYLDRMLASAGRMRQLIADLLAFSRVTTQASEFGTVDLGQVLANAQADLDQRLAETGGRVDVVPPLPAVRGDASLLRQVFQNLIANALKFARDGVPPVVRVTAETRSDGGTRVTVADNGIGFAPEFGEKIFELFKRLHPKTRYEGSGLGLAIVRKIVSRHGATIVAHGRPGEGATFVIDWPASGAGSDTYTDARAGVPPATA